MSGCCATVRAASSTGDSFAVGVVCPAGVGPTEKSHYAWGLPRAELRWIPANNETTQVRRYATASVSATAQRWFCPVTSDSA